MIKFKGHPIHVVFVHFPVACFILSFISNLLSLKYDLVQPQVFSFYLDIAGISLGSLALLTGFIDFISIKNPKAFRIALIHGASNFIWVGVFGFFVIVKIKSYPSIPAFSITELLIKGLTIAGIFYSDFLGGELVYKYKVADKENELNPDKIK